MGHYSDIFDEEQRQSDLRREHKYDNEIEKELESMSLEDKKILVGLLSRWEEFNSFRKILRFLNI
jgi:hypothetical protein